jgi:four helix bundle protein
MSFVTYDVALSVVRGLQQPLAVIRRHNPNLARQGARAVESVLLNIAEGSGRAGGDRLHHFRIALGSLREVGAVLEIATLHGWVEQPMAAERDRLGGLLYGLLRR